MPNTNPWDLKTQMLEAIKQNGGFVPQGQSALSQRNGFGHDGKIALVCGGERSGSR